MLLAARVVQAPHCLKPDVRDPDLQVIEPPEVHLWDDPSGSEREMKLALIGGVLPKANHLRWVVVGFDGQPVSLDCLRLARLYPFTKVGMAAALADGEELKRLLEFDDTWTTFTSRVLVEGPWEDPEEVTPTWIIEGLERPVVVKYYFM